MFPLGATADQLEAQLDDAIGAYQRSRAATEGAPRARTELSATLLGCVAPQFFSGAERLIVIPDGALHYLPFELLPHPLEDGLLDDHHSVAYAPSATALDALRRLWRPGQQRGEFLGFGDPAFEKADGDDDGAAHRLALRGRRLTRLPGTRDEVVAIASGFAGASAVYLDHEATEQRVIAERGAIASSTSPPTDCSMTSIRSTRGSPWRRQVRGRRSRASTTSSRSTSSSR
jgi:CHAT domain-containing protein